MRVGLLTWLHNGNYGSVLQAYALNRFITSRGFSVYNLDYYPSNVERILNLINSKNSPLLFLEKMEQLNSKRCFDRKQLKEKQDRFDEFVKENISLTKRIRNSREINEYGGVFDYYICGSDQIWSPLLFNPIFYLDFVEDEKKRIAYACSFGVNNISNRKKQVIKKHLEKFSDISVRERLGAEIIYDLLGERVKTTVDPTILLNVSDWDEISCTPSIRYKYALVYYLSNHAGYIKRTRRIAELLGLKLVVIPTQASHFRIEGELVQDAGPREWIGLIKNADFVITDSLHGCIFSLIFNKQFIVGKRFKDDDKRSQNSRIDMLLDEYGLKQRWIDNLNSIQEISDWSEINKSLKKNAADSGKWLMDRLYE